MSYIFEALRKLEQKRQKEKVSRLLILPEDVAPEPKRWHVWIISILGALLLANAVLLLLWLHPWAPRAEEMQARTEAARETANGKVQKEVDRGSAAAARNMLPEEPLRAESKVVPPAKVTEPAPPPVHEKRVSSAIRSVPVPQAKTETPAKTSAEPRPAPPNRILEFRELPASVKSALPELKISAHYYTEEPQSRFTRINEFNLREGQSLTGGVRLEHITPEGVVLSYEGYRFVLAIK